MHQEEAARIAGGLHLYWAIVRFGKWEVLSETYSKAKANVGTPVEETSGLAETLVFRRLRGAIGAACAVKLPCGRRVLESIAGRWQLWNSL